MEALIHHFKLFTEGFKVPEGEAYAAVESPRGELGCYLVSDRFGQAVPHAHPGSELREPPDAAPLMRNSLIADTVAIVSSVDPIMGEVDR
jgi:NADH-quinone oxidoreductase subunit D